jgi:neutral ceramidase
MFPHRKSLLLVIATLISPFIQLNAQEYQAGVGRADITPTEPIRLGGYASRNKPSEGIAERLFVKAVAIRETSGNAVILITADTIGVPRTFTDELARRIQDELKVPRERVLFACSHSHSAPVIHGALAAMYGLEGAEAEAVVRYAPFFLDQAFRAAQAAMHDLAPARLSFGQGEAFFARNRRQFTVKGVILGINPDGLTDRVVPVLRVDRPDGSLKAVLFGYACHCTTAGATYDVSSDWAGYAQEAVERAYPGATALFITGCGGDANPYPRGSEAFSRAHGLQLGGAVARVLNEPMAAVSGPIRAASELVELPLDKTPDKSYYEAKLTEKAPATRRYAQVMLDKLNQSQALATSQPAPLQVFRFGNALTLIALSGEVVSDYAFRLRRELPGEKLWVAGYCNDIFAYVPSTRVLLEGGYEADSSIIYYGLPTRFAPTIEDVLVQKVLDLVKQTGGVVPAAAKPGAK